MKKKIFFLIILLLALLAFTSFFGLYQARFLVGRASISQQSFSIDNSYLFLTPLRAKANTQEKIRVTVFVLNSQGLGVMGKEVVLGLSPNLLIESVQAVTDSYGKAVFDVSAKKPGEYYLEVKIDGKLLPQKAHLSYY